MADWEPTSASNHGVTIGQWRVNRNNSDRAWRIEHQCHRTEGSIWWPWTYSVENRGTPCTKCGPAPDEVQGVFWMLVAG